jgi:peptidoglycan hydrolase CwlO-like protein
MRRFFVFLVGLGFLVAPAAVYAQSVAQSVAGQQAQLQSQLNSLESQIATQQSLLNTAQSQHQTLQTQIDALDAEITGAQLQIQAINVVVQQLNGGIGSDNQTLASLSSQLSDEQDSLAQILRQTQMLDAYSVVDVALSAQDVSGFFSDLDAFTSIKSALANSFDQIHQTSSSTVAQEAVLQAKLTEEEQLQQEAQLAKVTIQQQEAQKQQLLTETKGIEANYQKLIASNQQTAAQIRSELFQLSGAAAIPFGTALTYAEAAQQQTGTPAALTLGVLKQETDLGENLGTGNWKTDMNPTRDQPVFVYIMQELGLDPNSMPVSKRPSYGWGGAMGPGQFIPSTWVCYGGFINTRSGTCTPPAGATSSFWQGPWQYVVSDDRVRKLTGESTPSNPYSPQDAIMATALLMSDNGASAGTPAAERLAALRYFAGWAGASNPAYSFYGDGVMEFAAQFQQEIDQLNGS